MNAGPVKQLFYIGLAFNLIIGQTYKYSSFLWNSDMDSVDK